MRAYPVDLDLLRFIAASRTLMLQLPQEALDAPFHLWEDGRAALQISLRAVKHRAPQPPGVWFYVEEAI
ncbi:MAG: hypothetical protein M3N50_09070 [Pseudomonadota bacterium]|nr:hypothetical protein [Pseudomonadota bacterium]